MLEWTPGPPPEEEDKTWIVESKDWMVYRVRWADVKSKFVETGTRIVFETIEINSNNILRHMPYEPMPEPLKPWRRFTCVDADGRRGSGAVSPDENDPCPYKTVWEGVDYGTRLPEATSAGVTIDWIDDGT